jgi:hypothetical protein
MRARRALWIFLTSYFQILAEERDGKNEFPRTAIVKRKTETKGALCFSFFRAGSGVSDPFWYPSS